MPFFIFALHTTWGLNLSVFLFVLFRQVLPILSEHAILTVELSARIGLIFVTELQDASACWLLLYPWNCNRTLFKGLWAFTGIMNHLRVSVYMKKKKKDMDMWSVPWTHWHLDLRGAKWSWFSVISSKRSSPQPTPAALVSVLDLLFGQRERTRERALWNIMPSPLSETQQQTLSVSLIFHAKPLVFG